jgi:hypothetical protein
VQPPRQADALPDVFSQMTGQQAIDEGSPSWIGFGVHRVKPIDEIA